MGEDERGHDQRLRRKQHLGPDQQHAAIHAVDPHARERCKQEGGHLADEADDAQQKRRAGKPIDQPRGRDARHPGADERDRLTGEEEAEIAVAQCSPGVGKAARRGASAAAVEDWLKRRTWSNRSRGRRTVDRG